MSSTIDQENLITRYRIYISPMGNYRNSEQYTFIAEFEQEELARNYVVYMRGKKRYSNKDIIVLEVNVRENDGSETTTNGKVAGVITVLGESLPVEEFEFS